MNYATLLLTVASLLASASSLHAADSPPLWQIGSADRQNSEFSLAPGDYRKFKEDGFFVVGSSSPAQDWPYVHPGPADSWAGQRQHSFAIVFALAKVPDQPNARLVLRFLDAHAGGPPRLAVSINGRTFEKTLPAGAGDETIFGHPEKGKPFSWDIPLPAGLLKPGNNEITITSVSGSWALYDSIALEAAPGTELGTVVPGTRLAALRLPPVWLKEEGKPVQPITLHLRHIGPDAEATITLGKSAAKTVQLHNGLHTLDLRIPASDQPQQVPLSLVAQGTTILSTNLAVAPPRIRTMWILPHSHVDIGYTHRQDDIIAAQIGHLEKSMELSRESAAQPPGMRFKWNSEAVWALDHFLKRATPEKRARLIQAIRDDQIGVDALYGNMLTALCRPEELAMCMSFGAQLSNETGKRVLSASICDVPGYTWGIVPTMAQAGVKYFAIGPNYSDRVGTIHQWDDKPFYWKSQSGLERILCWVVDNYHHLGDLDANVIGQIERLNRAGFPYDTSFIFWVGQWPGGAVDNAPPDEKTVEKVVAWNARYAAPQVKIGLVNEFFRDFESRYGKQLPEVAGDLTPYWEDGAGSTSRETALNRESADKLSQASALTVMRQLNTPSSGFEEAWKNVLLYTEHTWGAWCSISKPDDAFTLDQWRVKQGFALQAAEQAKTLLAEALPKPAAGTREIEVFNTTQWERSDLAAVPTELAPAGILSVCEPSGKSLPSQRLASGELVFLAKNVPPFGSKRFLLSTSPPPRDGKARAAGTSLENRLLRLDLHPLSGAVQSLRLKSSRHEYVDPAAPVGLNDFRYLLGTGKNGAATNGPVKISVADAGPLVASLRVESAAPGCNSLVRWVRVVDGLDRVELINDVDRKSVREKDGVHFGFGFNVPNGTIRMETPWAVVRPNDDQLPGSCRNWFTVQRWVDVSARDRGITWAPLDAPLMQIGGMTANLLGSVALHEWMTNAIDSETIYSWAQNNHWHTNYKIDQPGLTRFRYLLRPHQGGYDAMDAARFGLETSRPLLVASPAGGKLPPKPLFSLSSDDDVLIETVKNGADGRSVIIRLFGVTGEKESVALRWGDRKPSSLWVSDLTEQRVKPVTGKIQVQPYQVITLRAEM